MKAVHSPGDRKRRFGLVSPCAGNLGNAAILSSVITNIRARNPNAEFIGITLSAEDTQRRHGISAFPISKTFRPNYCWAYTEPHNNGNRRRVQWLGVVKGWLKKSEALRRLVRKVRVCQSELGHITKAGRLVRTLDCVMVGGGGAFDEFWGGRWGHPWTLFKFGALSRAFGVPFVILSVGKCSLEHPLSRFFAKSALRFASYCSFRDNDSLEAMHLIAPFLSGHLCPDLAYGYEVPEALGWYESDAARERLVVGVSPIAWFDPRSWPIKDTRRFQRYLHELAAMVIWLVRQQHRVMLFSTDSPDINVIRDLFAALPKEVASSSKIEILPAPPEQTTDDLLRKLCGTDLVIASRLHGVILSHLIALPVVAISYDPKVDSHMKEVEQFEYRLDIDKFDVGMLIERFGVLREARARESAHLRRMVQRYREEVNAQYNLLFGAVPSDARSVEQHGQYASVES